MSRYRKFIESRGTPKETEYYEVHHIIPRCLGGTDVESNLIKLTAREHFIAHWLLWKENPNNNSLALAFMMMQNNNSTQKRYKLISSKVYSNLKSAAASYNSECGKKRRWYNDGINQYHVEPNNANSVWFNGRLRGTLDRLCIDIYDKSKTLLGTVSCTRDFYNFLNVRGYKIVRGNIQSICENASIGMGSRYGDVWVCFSGEKPVYRTWNTAPGLEKAKLYRIGRPNEEFRRMTQEKKETNGIFYVTPQGTMKYTDALEHYTSDILLEWCKKNPHKVITKLMISKTAAFNHTEHGHWIGKTRSEVGFGYINKQNPQ